MDMAYLLALQNFRSGTGAFLTKPMFLLTALAETFPLLLIAAVIYWCFNKRLGKIVIMNFAFCYALTTALKNTFCIYRPWMKNPAIAPAEGVLETAGGYSFPSGHSSRMASFTQPLIIDSRRQHKALWPILLFLMFAVPFSRNFLGVHTPQDVITGLLLSALVTCFSFKIDSMLEQNPDADTRFFLLASAFFLILTAVFILKPYPVDYRAGKIIYDPLKPRHDSFAIAANALGFLIGWYIERKFINFEIPKTPARKFFAAFLGLVFFVLLRIVIASLRPELSGSQWKFLKGFYPYIFIFTIWTTVIKAFFSKK